MGGFVATNPDGSVGYYRDGKRYWWLLSVLYPLQPFAAIGLHAATGEPLWLFAPLVFGYGILPILDALVGEDPHNPPEQFARAMDADPFYRRLTWVVVPLHAIALIGSAWWAVSQNLSPGYFFAMAIVAGMTSGLAINTGHELGHKKSALERRLAQLVLAIPAYGHFWIEHNRGHHRHVATREDPASARMGESIYRFAVREIPGALVRAWRLESERLRLAGHGTISRHNEILQSYAVTVLLQGGLVLAFGVSMLPFLLLHNAFAWWQLTSANYIEHYGLMRQRDEQGRLERCQPHHSWNSNHLVSNMVLFHLERHSDHHANPTRRYQSLRSFDDLPTLPNGYFGCYLLAYVPPLWYQVMDPRLLALPHVDGDLARVNLDPASSDQLIARYGRKSAANA